jgi:uncharacterized membrane protein YcjF (UPF0283 family)
MSTSNYNNMDELGLLIKKSLVQPLDIDFEDKIMQRILLIETSKTAVKKSLKLSWLFLAVSVILFPLSYMLFFRQLHFDIFSSFGLKSEGLYQILHPAGIIIFSVILLFQIDNLIRLSARKKLV